MSSIIRIKRSGSSGAPSPGLAAGELAYSFAGTGVAGSNRLYIGTGTETNGIASGLAIVGGKYYTDMMAHQLGVLTANSALLVDAEKKLDNLKVDNLDLNGNTIISTDTNGDINITPNGTGSTRVKNLVADVSIVTNLTETRVPYVGTSSTLSDSANFTWSNSQNTLNITGILTVDNLKLDGNILSATNTNGDITITPDGTGCVIIDSSRALVVPVGASTERPVTGQAGFQTGAIRFNTTISQFEGYIGSAWSSLGGVKSVDGKTYISAELNPGNSDDTLRFYSNDVLQMSLDTGSLDIYTGVTEVNINATTASTNTTNGALIVVGGVGIGGQLNVGGDTNKFTASTASTTTTTGAVVVTGGVGIGGNLNVGSDVQIDGDFTVNAPSNVYINSTDTLDVKSSGDMGLGITANSSSTKTLTVDVLNSGLGGADLDINVKNVFTLDATTIEITGTDTSNLVITTNSSSDKTLTLNATNSGSGKGIVVVGSTNTDEVYIKSDTTSGLIDVAAATVTSTAIDTNINSDTIDITTSGSSDIVNLTTDDFNINANTIDIIGKNGSANTTVNVTGTVNVDNLRLTGNTISSTDGSNTITIDPAPTDDIGGTLIIKGNLQVDGTTTTVNSTQVTIDDPIFTLGGDTAPASNDNLDRGIIYRWYDSLAKIGYFGLDTSQQEFVFIPTATDSSSVISGTLGDAAFGQLRLDRNTESTTTSTGTLKVTGGIGITGQLNVGGTINKFTSTQDTSSVTTGAVVISGGVGINKSLYVGDNITGSGSYALGTLSVIDNFEMDGGTY